MRSPSVLMWIIAPVVLLVLLEAAPTGGTLAASGEQCGPEWRLLPARADRDHCAIAKATAMALADQQARQAQQAALVHRPPPSIPNFTPVLLWPEPDVFKGIRELPLDGAAGGPWGPTTSLWKYGAVPNDTYTEWDGFYVYATAGENGHPELRTLPLNGRDPGQQHFRHRWTSPRSIGTLTIMAITPPAAATPLPATPPHPFPDPAGVVQFTSSSGQQGTFDVTSQTWAFAS